MTTHIKGFPMHAVGVVPTLKSALSINDLCIWKKVVENPSWRYVVLIMPYMVFDKLFKPSHCVRVFFIGIFFEYFTGWAIRFLQIVPFECVDVSKDSRHRL